MTPKDAPDTAPPTYCCEAMQRQIEYRCPMHPDPWDCPDNLVVYARNRAEFGIVVRDGENGSGESYVRIEHCPWCGARLPHADDDDDSDTRDDDAPDVRLLYPR